MASSRWIADRQWGEGSTHMTQISRGILAAVAISLSLGAVAWGRDLVSVPEGAAGAPETAINRIAKTDRAAIVPAPVQTRTIALRLEALADTSVLARLSLDREPRNPPSGPMINKSGNRKLAVACVPSRQVPRHAHRVLQIGRCVT